MAPNHSDFSFVICGHGPGTPLEEIVMTRHKLIISSILITLVQMLLIVPAFATLTWGNNDPNVTWITDPVNDVVNDGATPSTAKDILKIGMGDDISNSQYVFRMYLNGSVPNQADAGTIYNIYFSADNPPIDHYMTYSFSYDGAGKFHKSTSSDLDSWAFGRPDGSFGKILEWKVNKDEIQGSIFNFMGATTDSTGLLTGTHPYDIVATPIPAAAWLLGSGIIGLIGIKRRNQNRAVGETQKLA
jgi:hypothetical protein